MPTPITRRSVLLVLAVLAAVPAPAHARRARRGSDVPVDARIVNGLLTAQFPSTGVLLTPGNPAVAQTQCTGTLIGCDTFLTAAHCVCDLTGADCQGAGAPHPGDFVVFFQHAGFFAVSSVAVHPTFDFPVGDVAVLKLATPVTGIAPTPINTNQVPPPGTPATIVGFGRSGDPNFDYGIKRAGAVVTAPCQAGVSDATSVCFNFTAPLGAPGSNSDTCNGDSGGPLFVDFGCGPVVAGTTSGGSSDACLPNDASYDGNVYYYRTWIQAQGGADLLNTSCGAMPQAGDADTTITPLTGALDAVTTQATHTVTVPAGTTRLRIALNAVDDGSDFDLYVKQSGVPTTVDFDCAAVTASQFGICQFAAPVAGTWHVLVRRKFGSGTYQVTATTFGSSLPGSGFDGQACSDGNSCTASDVCQAGNCVGTAVPDGIGCDDGQACTGTDACSAGVCVGTPTPLAACKAPLLPGKAQLTVKDNALPTRDSLVWRWTKGAATSLADFGDPTAAASYELCVFDQHAGVPTLALDAKIPAGANWQAFSKGFKYRDRTLASDGVTAVLLKTGADGQAGIVVRAKGANLATPALPFGQDPTVTVQLVGANACWEARYSTHVLNVSGVFKAKAD
jgi:hypothetical protein